MPDIKLPESDFEEEFDAIGYYYLVAVLDFVNTPVNAVHGCTANFQKAQAVENWRKAKTALFVFRAEKPHGRVFQQTVRPLNKVWRFAGCVFWLWTTTNW